MRLEPARDRASSPAACRAGSAVVSATNGKTTTAAMAASMLERAGIALVHNRAGANMAGGLASTLLAAARRGGADRRRARPVRGRRVLARPGHARSCSPRAVLLGNLFRDQLDRYGELETIADRWAAVVAALPAGARLVLQRRRPADRRPRPRARRRHATSASRIRRWRCPRCSTPRTPSTAAAAAPRTSTTRSTSATSAATAARRAASERPEPTVAAEQIELRRDPQRRASRCARRPARVDVELPLPGLYNVYNALGAAALCLELGVVARARSPPACRRVTAAFGRAERVAIGEHRAVDPADQEPRRRQRDPAHARARAGRARPARDPQRPDRRRPRRLLGLGRRLRDARRRASAASPAPGTRAAELALRLKYAGVPADRLTRRPGLLGARSTRPWPAPPSGRLFALPTYTALLELRDELAARGHVGAVLAARAASARHERRSGTTSSAAATPRTSRCGARSRASTAIRCSTSAPGTGRVALDLARARPRA